MPKQQASSCPPHFSLATASDHYRGPLPMLCVGQGRKREQATKVDGRCQNWDGLMRSPGKVGDDVGGFGYARNVGDVFPHD